MEAHIADDLFFFSLGIILILFGAVTLYVAYYRLSNEPAHLRIAAVCISWWGLVGALTTLALVLEVGPEEKTLPLLMLISDICLGALPMLMLESGMGRGFHQQSR